MSENTQLIPEAKRRLRTIVARSIASGQTFDQFMARFNPAFCNVQGIRDFVFPMFEKVKK